MKPDKITKGALLSDEDRREGPTGDNHLLVIAIDQYKYAPVLHSCVREAKALVEILTEKYQFDPKHVIALYGDEDWAQKEPELQPTRKNILDTLESLREKVKEEDNLVILFSGHGEADDDVGYWVPVEAEVGKRRDYVSEFDLRVELNKINSFHTFLIVDACFAGSLFASYRNITPGNEDKRSRWGLVSSHSREVALDGTQVENSPFITYLLRTLKRSDADIGIHKLAATVMDEVRQALNGRQNPVFEPLGVKGHDLGQFVFHRRGLENFLDTRDNKVYQTMKIDGKVWMVRNLDFDAGEGCWNYQNNAWYAELGFGKLYTWEAAHKACPDGWRLPTEEEWDRLRTAFGKGQEAYDKLLKGGSRGFDAVLGGWRKAYKYKKGGSFNSFGEYGVYWSATETESGKSAARFTFDSHHKELNRRAAYKGHGLSVRCIKKEG